MGKRERHSVGSKCGVLDWSASCPNSQHARQIRLLRIEDNPRSDKSGHCRQLGKLAVARNADSNPEGNGTSIGFQHPRIHALPRLS